MTNMPLDGLSIYPQSAVAENFRLQEALSADIPDETTAEEKPKRKRRSRQTDKKE